LGGFAQKESEQTMKDVSEVFRQWFFDQVQKWNEEKTAIELRLQSSFYAGWNNGYHYGWENGFSEGKQAAERAQAPDAAPPSEEDTAENGTGRRR